MDFTQGQISEDPAEPPDNTQANFGLAQQFGRFNSTNICFGVGSEQSFPEFGTLLSPYFMDNDLVDCVKTGNQFNSSTFTDNNKDSQLSWDPKALLTDLDCLDQKLHQVQGLLHSITGRESERLIGSNEFGMQMQQNAASDLTGILLQLISAASNLLSSLKKSSKANSSFGQLGSVDFSSSSDQNNNLKLNEAHSPENLKKSEYEEPTKVHYGCAGECSDHNQADDHLKDCEDGMECENLPPGSYEVLQLEKEEILAPHTHFCRICGKGFKRDANLRMHMRGHGDEYKTAAALAKPSRDSSSEPVLIKRYSCPFVGCKRNKEHKKFQPLKTILCVKNHYKRSHCDKSYTCSRCNSKKFSVIADLKTHEKHCGRDKWICSCGTTFSRKDKLFGHVALFQGHTPALPSEEIKGSGVCTGPAMNSEQVCGNPTAELNFGGSSYPDNSDLLDVKDIDEDQNFFSSFGVDSCNFGGFSEFPRPSFEASDSSFLFMPPVPGSYTLRNGEN